MIEIKYRIIIDETYWRALTVEQIDCEGGIEGFFQLNLQSESYGYCHQEPLRDGEEGFDLISTWLDQLLEVCLLSHETKYVAIKDIESYNTWLQFVVDGEEWKVSVIQVDGLMAESVLTSPVAGVIYPEWRDVAIKQNQFTAEVVRATNRFIVELAGINPLFSRSERVLSLQAMLDKLKG